jgi:hypothetical protein
VVGLHVMIGAGQHLMRSVHGATGCRHGIEGMTSSFMEQQVIAVKQVLADNFSDLVAPPDLVKQGLRPVRCRAHGHIVLGLRSWPFVILSLTLVS